jgi:hypothetical protein
VASIKVDSKSFFQQQQYRLLAWLLIPLIGNCHRVGLNAEAYLAELFERLPSATTKTVHELTPHAIAAKRRAEAPAATQEVRESRLTTA